MKDGGDRCYADLRSRCVAEEERMLRRWFSRQVTLRVEPDMLHDEEFWADVELPPKRVRARWKLWLEFAAFVVGERRSPRVRCSSALVWTGSSRVP